MRILGIEKNILVIEETRRKMSVLLVIRIIVGSIIIEEETDIMISVNHKGYRKIFPKKYII